MRETCDILVVEDEPSVQRAVVMICTEEGLQVDAVDEAGKALELLKQKNYRLVLCDVMLPGMDGFGLLEELSHGGRTVPVVMMTGYSTMENAVKSLSLGALDYIPKPFTADELLTVIQRSIRSGVILGDAEAARLEGQRSFEFVACPSGYRSLGYVSWVLMEDEGTAKIGINDLFVKTVDGIDGIELSAQGEVLVQGVPCAVVTARDGSTHHVMCPMGGKIIEVNADVLSDPSLVEKDPYFRGWLYQVLPSNPDSNLQWLSS